MPCSPRLACAALTCAILGACSSGSGEEPAEPAPPPPERGTLLAAPQPLAPLTAAELFAQASVRSSAQLLLELIADPECGVEVHRLRYQTVDPHDAPITSSAALMTPAGEGAACQGTRPLVVYAHGTVVERAYDIADLSDEDNVEGLLIATAFAAQGYIVVAPNYAGLGDSTLDYHPYLHADQQSKDAVDALEAARSALSGGAGSGVTDSGELFITGYSEGGHVAMATHRLLQESGQRVDASAPMSGPYALAAFGDAVFQGQVPSSAPLLFAYLVTGYQRAYGNLYTQPTELFAAEYAADIENILPTDGTRADLFAQGRLPPAHLFSSTPPQPAYAPFTPATEPAALAHVFARGFGEQPLVENTFRLGYLQDAQAHPDGGFPDTTDGAPAADPRNALRMALKANDLRNWAPQAPVLLCAGNEDPTVLYLNTQLMQGYWSATAPAAPVEVLDVDSEPSTDDPRAPIKQAFATAKQAVAGAAVADGAEDGGISAVADAYHSALVPPFCLAAVRSFFDER